MAKKHDCPYCMNGELSIPIVFAEDNEAKVVWCNYCPMCGRELEW